LSRLIKRGIEEYVQRIDFQSVVQSDSFPASADETQFYHPWGSPVRITKKNVIFHICAAGQHIYTYVRGADWVGGCSGAFKPPTAVAAGFFGLTQLRRAKLHSPQKKMYGSGCNHTWN
jgi:hypothetical protein